MEPMLSGFEFWNDEATPPLPFETKALGVFRANAERLRVEALNVVVQYEGATKAMAIAWERRFDALFMRWEKGPKVSELFEIRGHGKFDGTFRYDCYSQRLIHIDSDLNAWVRVKKINFNARKKPLKTEEVTLFNPEFLIKNAVAIASKP